MGTNRLSARVAQPLAVTGGRFQLANGTALEAAATARESVLELGLETALFGAPLSFAAFHRSDAGNIAGISDTGAAFTWRVGF
jgi:hypothetical protein